MIGLRRLTRQFAALTFSGLLVMTSCTESEPKPAQPTAGPMPPIDGSVVAESSASPAPTPASQIPTSTAAVDDQAQTPTVQSDSVTPLPEPEDPADFARTVEQLIEQTPAHIGASVQRADGSVLFEREPNEQFEAASLYKLLIMVETFRQREAGLLAFDETIELEPWFFLEDDSLYGPDVDLGSVIAIGELLHGMITVSSNVAAAALLARVGTDNVNLTSAELGLTATEIRWYPLSERRESVLASQLTGQATDRSGSRWRRGLGASDPASGFSRVLPVTHRANRLRTAERLNSALPDDALNVTTPTDIARLFALLLAGEVVSQSASVEMLDLLAQQQINDRLPALLPDDALVAHKTGNLDNVVHDAGIVYAPAGPIIVVLMSDEVEDEAAVVELMSQVGRLAYDLPN